MTMIGSTINYEVVIELERIPEGSAWCATTIYEDKDKELEVGLGSTNDDVPVASITLGEFKLKITGSYGLRKIIRGILRKNKDDEYKPTPQLTNALRKVVLSEVGVFGAGHPAVMGKILTRNYERGVRNGERRWRRKFKAFIEGED